MTLKSFLDNKSGQNNYVGKIGEDFACEFLKDKGFTIKDRGYKSKFGEIDIIAIKDKKVYFFEVKTSASEKVTPFDNMNFRKVQNFKRNVEVYILKHKFHELGVMFSINFIAVYLNNDKTLKKVELIENLE